MSTNSLKEIVQKFVAHYPVQSIAHYPHPLTTGGVIILFPLETADFLTAVGFAYQQFSPFGTLHCLRPNELFQLTHGGMFAPPFQINEYAHLLPWLKQKGTIVYGEDFRPTLHPSYTPADLLNNHLEGCRDSLRRYGIVPLLVKEKYAELVGLLGQELVHLMATAVLPFGEWDISLETVNGRFLAHYPHLHPLVTQLNRPLPHPNRDNTTHYLYTFEQLLTQLGASL